MSLALDRYVTLGRSGLRVSPICLGTMTFGTEWNFGVDEATSQAIFDHYIDAGGNFVDTANGYTGGTSEKMVGKFIASRNVRDRVVLATKFTFSTAPGDPNAGGNGRKNIYRSLDHSLERLQTDWIDLYWLHAWDTITPIEEVISTLGDLVRAGKILHYGFSDVPAWYATRAHTLAEKEGIEPPIALQLEYSLLERGIEREHIPAAQVLGMGICPWGALASGLLTGKYKRQGNMAVGEGRISAVRGSFPGLDKTSDHAWPIVEALMNVAQKMQRPAAQVAQNWVLTQPGITSVIIGATKIGQADDSIAATAFSIPADLRQQLDEASALETLSPYGFFGAPLQERIHGGTPPAAWTPARVTGAPLFRQSDEAGPQKDKDDRPPKDEAGGRPKGKSAQAD